MHVRQQRLERLSRRLRMVLNVPVDLLQMVFSDVPGPLGQRLRYWLWKRRLKFLGKGVIISEGVYFQNPQYISIDDNCWIDRGVMILAGPDRSARPRRLIPNREFQLERGHVHIGKRVHVGPFAIISGIGGVHISDDCGLASGFRAYSFTHHFRSDDNPSDRSVHFSPLVDHSSQYMIEGPIFLDANVGAALNVVILPGVSIGEDSFINIGSVVTTSIEPNSLISGYPAKRIRERYKDAV